MESPYYGKKYKKKGTKIIETQTLTTNENTKNKKTTKDNKRNDLKGGSVLENNHQDENSRFITKARKKTDNV